MSIYSFESNMLERDPNQNNLFGLTTPTVIYNRDFNGNYLLSPHIVQREEEMRIDLICSNVYGNTLYIEEIMKLNNILNRWSVKEDDILYMIPPAVMNEMYAKKEVNVKKDLPKLVDSKKNTQIQNPLLPPSVKPSNLKQISLDENGHKITIINKFE